MVDFIISNILTITYLFKKEVHFISFTLPLRGYGYFDMEMGFGDKGKIIYFTIPNNLFAFLKNILFLCCGIKIMNMKVDEKMVIPLQIKNALDGRSQRWLAKELGLTDDAMSRRMNGILNFTDDELSAIEEKLNFKIKQIK